MILSLIVAIAENHVVGRDQTLPWHIPADLKRFKQLTTGHPIIMGRKTYESIGRPLPNRQNIIITRSKNFPAPPGAVTVAGSLEEALKPYVGSGEEVFVIGGAEIYRQALGSAQRIYLTKVHQEVPGDVTLELGDLTGFEVTYEESHPHELIPYTFINYQRIKQK